VGSGTSRSTPWSLRELSVCLFVPLPSCFTKPWVSETVRHAQLNQEPFHQISIVSRMRLQTNTLKTTFAESCVLRKRAVVKWEYLARALNFIIAQMPSNSDNCFRWCVFNYSWLSGVRWLFCKFIFLCERVLRKQAQTSKPNAWKRSFKRAILWPVVTCVEI